MAERRRRRQAGADDGVLSEGESQEADQLSADSDHPSENEFMDISEYDSAEDEQSEVESVDDAKSEAEAESPLKDTEEPASEKDDDDASARESGDGKSDNDQEGKGNKKVLKIAENRNSPLFIPTKGNFYQHDVRSDSARSGRRGGRIVQSDMGRDRWLHDKYDEEEQAPKSRDELIDEYGYDIRTNKDKYSNASRPTRRPDRRRGGRGGGGWNGPRRNERPEGRNPEVPQSSRPPYRERGSMRSRNFHATRNSSSPRRSETQAEFAEPPAEPLEKSSNFKKPYRSSPQNGSTNSKSSEVRKVPARQGASNMDSILDVINNKEQENTTRDRSMKSDLDRMKNIAIKSDMERMKNLAMKSDVDRMKNLSINKESSQPKRYSSLRQRGAEPPVNQFRQSMSPRHRPIRSPKLPPEWSTNRVPTQGSQSPAEQQSASSQPTAENVDTNTDSSKPIGYLPATSLTYSNSSMVPPSETVNTKAPPGTMVPQPPKLEAAAPSLAQLQWYEAALAYQQAMLSQSLLAPPSSFVPHPTPPHENPQSIGESPLLLNTEAQTASPPQIPQLPHTLPQGDMAALSSLVFPPPLPHELHATNFPQRLPDRNVLPPSMQPQFPPAANLIGQQVGGVTYYQNPLQGLQHMQVPGASPADSPMARLNAAIPIRYPIE